MSRIHLPSAHAGQNGARLKARLPDDYSNLAREADQVVRDLTAKFPRAAKMYGLLLCDPRADAHWNLSNYLTVGKLNYNDHGPIHARVTAAYAMEILTLLAEANVPMDVMASNSGDLDDTFLVTLAAVMLHDMGNALHRIGHESLGVLLAQPILERILPEIYRDPEQRFLIMDFILSAIQCHDMNPPPLYMEGAVVAVADGCDMTKGRARMPFDLGKIDIHAVSALSIEDVNIKRGKEVPVEIEVLMSNSAGIFQVEETLVKKLNLSPLRTHMTVSAAAIDPNLATDRRIIERVVLKNGRLTPA